MRSGLLRKPLVLGTVVALTIGLGAGTAFAYFTSSGTGFGSANTGTVQAVTVIEATGTATNKLYPGASGDLLLQVNNPNSFAVKIVAISGNGTITGAGGSGTCNTTGVSVTSQTGLSISLAAGANSIVVPNGVTMDTTSDNGCQGATFQVPVTLTVRK